MLSAFLCFSCFSLSSSAVELNQDLLDRGWVYDGEAYVLPSGVYDPVLFGSTTLLAPEKNFSSFDPKLLPWTTAPQYIQDIAYMSLEGAGTNKTDPADYKMPFVLIRVTSSTASVYVGYNIGLGYDLGTNRMRIAVVEKFYNYSVCYQAQFSTTDYSVKTDWRQLSATDWSTYDSDEDGVFPVRSFTSTLAYPTSSYDFYFYGGNGVYLRDVSVANFSLTSSNDVQFQIDNNIGFQCGRYFYQDSASTTVYCEYFQPPTPAQIEQELQKEEVETSKGIWETLKSIPEMIAEKLKGLFVPSDGYFDALTTEFQEFFSERLGVVYELPEAVITILQQLIEFEPLTDGYYIPIPEVVIPVRLEDGTYQDFQILEEQDYRFDFLSEGAIGTLYSFYRAFCWLTCILGLISLAIRTYADITDD